jgi:hypothetical protein
MKKLTNALFGLMIISLLTSCSEKPAIVLFNDAILEAQIRTAMNRTDGDITLEEAEAVKVLELSIDWDLNKPNDEKIQDISALQYFKNIERLDI